MAERDDDGPVAERGPGAAYAAFVLMEELLDKLKELIGEMLNTEWLPMHSDQKPEDYPYINAFIVSGTIEVFKVWVQGGMQKSARDLAALIERLALEGIH